MRHIFYYITLLLFSSERDKMAKFLIENKADVNARNKFGETPLHSAIIYGKFQLKKINYKCENIP